MNRPTTSPPRRQIQDYRALHEGAAMVDLGSWTVLELLGNETRAFLQGIASQEFDPAPPPSRATRTLFLTEKGRPVAHAWVAFERQPEDPMRPADPETAWVLSDPGARDSLRPHLERFRVMEDVEFRGPDDMPRLLGVAGPERDRLAGATASRIPGAVAIRGEPLSFVLAPSDHEAASLGPFVDAGAFEAWRIEVGLPYQGLDFDTERIATELSLPEAISMTKGCYVGQEVIIRVLHRGPGIPSRESAPAAGRVPLSVGWTDDPRWRGDAIRRGGVRHRDQRRLAARNRRGSGDGLYQHRDIDLESGHRGGPG